MALETGFRLKGFAMTRKPNTSVVNASVTKAR
jgi:hypothetical protein